MQLGIFDRTFERDTLAATLAVVKTHGVDTVQFHFQAAGLEALPAAITPSQLETIRKTFTEQEVTIAAVSGTFNMIHPDVVQRQDGLARLGVVAKAARQLGVDIVTLCTGTRNPDSMWRAHPDNSSPEAWRDLVDSMAVALQSAEAHDITLVVETEVSNVMDSAQKARQLLDEMASEHLKIVIDGANLFHSGQLPRMHEVMNEAFDLLGEDIVMAHAKDLDRDGEAGHEAAGTGLLDYDHYIALLRKIGFQGAIVAHSLTEEQAPAVIRFLKEKLGQQ